jgi:hypothetical protein
MIWVPLCLCGAGAHARATLSRNLAAVINANALDWLLGSRLKNREVLTANNVPRIPLLGAAPPPEDRCPSPSFDAALL